MCGTEPGQGKMCVDGRPLVAPSGSCIACSATEGTLSRSTQGLSRRSCLSNTHLDIREDSKELQASKLKALIPWPGEIKTAHRFSIDLMPWEFPITWIRVIIQEAEPGRTIGLGMKRGRAFRVGRTARIKQAGRKTLMTRSRVF